MKLLALDGNSIVNRAFYGIKLLTTKDGRYTNAIYGFMNILDKLLEQEQPDGVAVAFDLKAPTFRHKKYAAYKAGRKGMPDELAEQLPTLKKLLTCLGYHCLEAEGYEADDILGTLADAAKAGDDTCVIATGDRDSLQLVDDRVTVLLAATKMGRPEVTVCDRDYILEKYGVTPPQMIEIKALQGDASDNIPGVPGVGEKTAQDLIQRFHDIDAIYADLEGLDIKPGVRKKLEAGRESAYLSRELGTICRTAPVSRNLADYAPGPRQEEEAAALLRDLEFFKLLEKYGMTPPPKAEVREKGEPYAYTADFAALCAAAGGEPADLIFDGGAAGLCVGRQISSLPLPAEREDQLSLSGAAAEPVPADAAGLEAFHRLLADESRPKRVHDAKAFYKYALQQGIQPAGIVFDTALAGYLSSPSANSYATDRLAAEYGVQPPEIPADVPAPAALAALHSLCCTRLVTEIEKNGQTRLLTDMEIPLSRTLASMELIGFRADIQGIRDYGRELGGRIAAIEKEIYGLVGYEFNLNSPKQLGEALFVKLGLPARKKTKSGYSTNAEVLESLRYEHPAVSLLLEYRQLAKLKSTYCDGLEGTVGPDGRIHSTFNQTETRTGRISSTEPNLQNIPVRQEEGRQLRKFFGAADGCLLCDADYSQIELRVLAHMADDKAMIQAFREGTDIHLLTASQVFRMPPELITPLLRSRAKAVNFGIVYGIGAFSLSKDIGVTRAEADEYIKGYMATYPGVQAYMERVVEEAKEKGYVTTLFGRRRYLPELSSSNANLRHFGERVARNMPIQGTAADIIKIAMNRVYDRLRREELRARLILQVHDELIVEALEEEAERVCRILKEEMEGAFQMAVPLSVDVHTGKTWYDAKG